MAAHSSAAQDQHLKRIESPIGRVELLSDGAALTGLAIERDGVLPHDDLPESSNRVLELAATQLEEYFHGQRSEFDLPVALHGTEFQVKVWARLAALGFGALTSYAELAESLGNPSAARAIGGAVGANPIPIVVPCHRVVGHDGAITGYSAGEGIPTKRWLLAHEGIPTNGLRVAIPATV